MSFEHRSKLEQLGLSPAEAQIYLAVLHHGPLAASAIASETGVPRTGVYPTLCSLVEKGLIEGGLGHRSKFAAVAAEEALRGLIAREEQTLSERQQIAKELTAALPRLPADAESALDDSVQVLRTPQLIGERFNRLQLEATSLIEGFAKAPFFTPKTGNPAQKKAASRGVQYKSLYERAVVDDPLVGPYLAQWVGGGEEARVYDGELPFKLFIFDREVVLSTLVRRSGHPAALLVRHAPYARAMGTLFEFLWNQGKPLVIEGQTAAPTARKISAKSASKAEQPSQRRSRNGRHAPYAKV